MSDDNEVGHGGMGAFVDSRGKPIISVDRGGGTGSKKPLTAEACEPVKVRSKHRLRDAGEKIAQAVHVATGQTYTGKQGYFETACNRWVHKEDTEVVKDDSGAPVRVTCIHGCKKHHLARRRT